MIDKQFFLQTLPSKTYKLVNELQDKQPNFLNNFYLSGGTALSLQIGHRESEDLDFFNQTSFDPQQLQQSSIEDIACTKLQTIGMRGSKKDFVDLHFLLKKFSLNKLFKLMQKKYQKINYSKAHILKSLVYFNDAEQQPMPRMHEDVSWDEVKEKMIKAVKSIKFE